MKFVNLVTKVYKTPSI